MLKHLLIVFLGGGIGACSRFLLSVVIPHTRIPWHTFLANSLGCLILGIVWVWVEKNQSNSLTYLLLITGFCGGFTTFSAFVLEHFNALKNGDYLLFISYAIASISVGLLALVFGIWFSKTVLF